MWGVRCVGPRQPLHPPLAHLLVHLPPLLWSFPSVNALLSVSPAPSLRSPALASWSMCTSFSLALPTVAAVTVLAVTDTAAIPATAAIAAGNGVAAAIIGTWCWPCCCSCPPSRMSTLSCAHSPSCLPARLCTSCNSIISI